MNKKYVNANLALTKANLLYKEKRFEEAVCIFDDIIVHDESCCAAYDEGSCNLQALGRFSETIRDLEKLIDLRPSSPTAYFRRARWLIEIGEYESALKNLYQVIDLDVHYFNGSAYFYLAVALSNTNRLEEALQACQSIPHGFKEFIRAP